MDAAALLSVAPLLFAAPPASSDAPDSRAEDERVSVVPERDDAAPVPNPPEDTPEDAPEDAPKSEPDSRRDSWQVELFVDVAYGFSSNLPENHIYRGMYTNPRLHELSVSTVGAFVRHPKTARQPWWIELGLHAGAAVDALTSAEPIPGGPDGRYAGAEVFKHIALANAGVEIRKTKTSFGAGVFESPMGIGSFWTFRNWNYTTSWESNVVPYYLAGARIAQQIGPVELAGYAVNGFQSYADLNAVPSGLVTLIYDRGGTPVTSPRTGTSNLRAGTEFYFGPESELLGPRDWLLYSDTWLMWDFDDHFSLAGVWDVAVDRPGRGRPDRQLYTGGALFARGTVLEHGIARMDLALRPELSFDRDGRFFGVDQWLISGTATANLWLWEHLLLRLEYRYDHSTAAEGSFYRKDAIADDAAGLAQDQHTVFLALTAWWDIWFGK